MNSLRIMAGVVGLLLLGPAFATGSETNRTPYVPTSKYATTRVAGWTVRVNRELLTTRAELGTNALALLKAKLIEVTNVVPPRACDALKRVTIWLGVNDGHAPGAEYHPSKSWLAEHGYNPDKAKGVEIGNAARFLQWSSSQPSMVLHELAHAYHDQVLGFTNAEIRAAFKEAQDDGRYSAVQRNNGRTERAYAMTNPQEYFAEATEAYFGTNDFYPFVRHDLERHDPALFELLSRFWHQ